MGINVSTRGIANIIGDYLKVVFPVAQEIVIDHANDSIKIGDGSTLADVTPANALKTDSSHVTQPISNSDITSIKTTLDAASDDYGFLLSSPIKGNNIGISSGEVNTGGSTAVVSVNKTAYTEQTSNAQRSLVSSNANDTNGGLGANVVTITYLSIDGASIKTTTVTLNGTTRVNTSVSDIACIEKMEVTTWGLTASNVGTISLFTGTGGAGTVMCSISPSDNKTKLAHHYIPQGTRCRIMSMYCGSSADANAERPLFRLLSKSGWLGKEQEIGTPVICGTATGTTQVDFVSPIEIVATSGFRRIKITIEPGNNNTNTQYASFVWAEV